MAYKIPHLEKEEDEKKKRGRRKRGRKRRIRRKRTMMTAIQILTSSK